MSTDTNTLILIQLIILLGAFLCISLAFNWFLRNKLNQVVNVKLSEKARESGEDRQQAHDAEHGIDTAQWSTSNELSALGELSGQQLTLSSQLKEMTTNAHKSSLNNADRVRFLDHIDELEASLLQSRKQINSVNNQLKQAQQDLQIERTKAVELKKLADHVPSLKLRETQLLEQAKQMSELIAHHEKEIKRLKQAPVSAPGISTEVTAEISAETRPVAADAAISQAEHRALKSELQEAKERLKRSEAERTLIENSFVELEASLDDAKRLQDEFDRLKKEYAMLEQRFFPEDS
jgi:predicted  nucleic acid-binding Zn-ribbon protein